MRRAAIVAARMYGITAILAGLLVACSSSPIGPAPPGAINTSVAHDAAVAALDATGSLADAVSVRVAEERSGGDEDHAPVGAVSIPDPDTYAETPLIYRDTSVVLDELPKKNARWRQRARRMYAGRVLIALHIARHTHLELSIVETEPRAEDGYPGSLAGFHLGATDTSEQPPSGNALPPYHDGEDAGPIMFAVRLRPRATSPESERRQVVVYRVGKAVLVAERRVGAQTWTPRLRLDLPRATELATIQPGWH